MAKFPMIVGRTEVLDLPGVVLSVPAKIDTGAFYSSIHCASMKVITRDGEQVLVAELLGHPTSPVTYHVEFTTFETASITNSFGHQEERYQVPIRVKLGPKVFTTQFTLADRGNNLFPILAGRKLLQGRFLVDVSRSGVDRLKLKKEFNIEAAEDAEDLE